MLPLVGVEWLFTPGSRQEEVNIKGMSYLTLSASSAGSAGFISILRDDKMFWWRVSSQESHIQKENMGTLAQGKPCALTAFIFLTFFLLWFKKLEVQKPLRRQAVCLMVHKWVLKPSVP